VQLLLQCSAKTNIKAKKSLFSQPSYTALELAQQQGHSDIVTMLQQHEARTQRNSVTHRKGNDTTKKNDAV
jgi:hypothetical protein